MGKYYLFAIFIFILCLVLIFIEKLFTSKKNKSDEVDNDGKNQKLLRLYRQIEDMMESFEAYAEEVKEEIATEKKMIKQDLVSLEQRLDGKLEQFKKTIPSFISIIDDEKPNQKLIKNNQSPSLKKENSSMGKTQKHEQVRRLYADGVDMNEIAKELNMTVSEIRLIVEVRK